VSRIGLDDDKNEAALVKCWKPSKESKSSVFAALAATKESSSEGMNVQNRATERICQAIAWHGFTSI
jgi:hypothetical protein